MRRFPPRRTVRAGRGSKTVDPIAAGHKP